MSLSLLRYAYNITLKEVMQILMRVVLEFPFQQQGAHISTAQYSSHLLPVSMSYVSYVAYRDSIQIKITHQFKYLCPKTPYLFLFSLHIFEL